jgi:hypothetical protein
MAERGGVILNTALQPAQRKEKYREKKRRITTRKHERK